MTGRAGWRPGGTAASIALLFGGALWGLFWLPLRAFSDAGLSGAWPGSLIYAGTSVVLLPLVIWRRRALLRRWRGLAACGLLTGAAFSLYSTSLLLTDVVHTILLFYLTPIWGTLLGWAVLGERITTGRALALGLALLGLVVVLGGAGGGLPQPRNPGDWLALVSGVFWAVGSLWLYRMDQVDPSDQIVSFVGGSLVVSALILLLGGPQVAGPADPALLWHLAPWALLAGLYVVPMTMLTIWPATLLSPGRAGVLLMSEVVVGVGSAAALSGEPFGLREAVGSTLIIAAAAVEVLGQALSSRSG